MADLNEGIREWLVTGGRVDDSRVLLTDSGERIGVGDRVAPVAASSAARRWSTSGASDVLHAGRSTDNVNQVSSRLIWSYW